MRNFLLMIYVFLFLGFFPDNILAKNPKNVILLIGDGMGLSQISYDVINNSNPSNFEKFKYIGLIKTSSKSGKITDSAAAATAFATGYKTANGVIGLDFEGNPKKTILELSKEKGLGVGMITTSAIIDATPAAFIAHQKSRKMYEEIASDFLKTDIDIFIGGGMKYFNNRSDKVDLTKKLEEKNYKIYTDETSLFSDSYQGKIAALLASDHLPKMQDNRGNYAIRATEKALDVLAKNKKGFFLMIEGSQIDFGGHDNDAEYIKQEMLDFDMVLGRVLEFAKNKPETLVIVTADHETGGFALTDDRKDKNKEYGQISPKFTSKGHSAMMIPVFAYGAGAEEFIGIYENTEIFWKIKKLLKI